MNEITNPNPAEVEQKPGVFSSSMSQRLLFCYGMCQVADLKTTLSYVFFATRDSYNFAEKDAARVVQQKEANRQCYSGRSGRLMEDFAFDEGIDPLVNETVINLFTVAINDYLADKQDTPQNPAVLKKVKVLIMQLIKTQAIDILSQVNIPPYVKDMVSIAEDRIDEGRDLAFSNWISDLEETGNDFLVDWMTTEIGPSIFGADVKTKPKDKYNQYMNQWIGSIKNPGALYDCYLKRRAEYDSYVSNMKYNQLYDIFDLTSNQFNKIQRDLFNDFQLRYSENVNAKYISRLLNSEDEDGNE